MPGSFLDFLNPDNAKENVKLAAELKAQKERQEAAKNNGNPPEPTPPSNPPEPTPKPPSQQITANSSNQASNNSSSQTSNTSNSGSSNSSSIREEYYKNRELRNSSKSNSEQDPLLEPNTLSREDDLLAQELIEKKNSGTNSFSLSEGGEEMTLPKEMPRSGPTGLKLSEDGPTMVMPEVLMGAPMNEEHIAAYEKAAREAEMADQNKVGDAQKEIEPTIENNPTIDLNEKIDGYISQDDIVNDGIILPRILPKTGSGEEYMTEYKGPGREMTGGIFSNLAYEDKADYLWNNIPADWRDAGQYYKGSYYSKVFVNDATKEIVIAHRGSDDVGDWIDIGGNAFSALTGLPHIQVKYGLQVHEKIADLTDGLGYEIIHSGHSLGGHIAEYVAMKKKTKAFSYDPLYGTQQDGYSNIWRYAPDDGVYAYSKTFVSGTGGASLKGLKELAETHNLGNILSNLSEEIVFEVYDQINPMADGVKIKSIDYMNLF